MLTVRKINVGITQTYILILIQVLISLTFFFDFMLNNFDDKKEIIYQVSYAYFYVSILYLIKKIVAENVMTVKYLNWIIKFEILKALSNILVTMGIHIATFLNSLFGLVLLILYIILIVNILNKKYSDIREIAALRPYVIALIFGFMITLLGGFYAEFNGRYEVYGILYLIMVIPYVFIIRYLKKMKIGFAKSSTDYDV